ncbi:MAG: hypothetical protein WC626_09220, partial [Methanoregula sp.]
ELPPPVSLLPEFPPPEFPPELPPPVSLLPEFPPPEFPPELPPLPSDFALSGEEKSAACENSMTGVDEENHPYAATTGAMLTIISIAKIFFRNVIEVRFGAIQIYLFAEFFNILSKVALVYILC